MAEYQSFIVPSLGHRHGRSRAGDIINDTSLEHTREVEQQGQEKSQSIS
jgi:hypothetical protein